MLLRSKFALYLAVFEQVRTLKQASELLKEVYIRKATDEKLEIPLQDAVIRNYLMINVVV